MKCSIVITGKNCSLTILDTLESINAQNINDDIEVVYVDDGSSDDSLRVVENFPFKGNVYLKTFCGNLGRAKALNKGVDISNGEYIAILDADDLFLSDKLESQVKVLDSNLELFLVATDYVVGESYAATAVNKNIGKVELLTIRDFLRGNPICHSSVLMRKEIAHYDEGRRRHLDLELWLRLSKNEKKIAILREPLTFKRLHKGQSFESKGRLSYIVSSYFLTLSYAKPFWKYYQDILIRTARLFFHLLPRRITTKIKKALL
ncbi:glycosyltransferase family 2 protein [Photobacterium halotolerans]|nr:glycosyltransferase [Photobacterium halotolerans]